jgi:Ricin-type beta-trefoil lectin domain
MLQFIKTLSIFLISLSLLISNLNFKLSISLEAKNNEPATSKKILKKKLSLDYTHPKFETDLNQDQKIAILKSLKKWKGELPIDNQFTVTSIANLKSNINDESKQFKKKNKNISDALVVYMWSQTPNPNYDPKNPGESEEGDSMFIRTQFNVLLKQNKNGNWKASLERDSESKAESLDIIESDIDAQIYKDLFATDNTDNAFTATEEVLIEDANTAPETSSKSNNTISILSVSSIEVSTSSSQTISSQIVPIISPVENSPQPVPKEKTSWLQSILGFGSVKASASISEYSWPWANGETWEVTNGWHECLTVNSATPNIVNFVGEIKGCSLDISQKNTGASNIVKAPITSTVIRACEDPDQSVLNFGNKVSITHVKTNSLLFNTGAFVRKADNVGIVFDPTIYPKSDPKWIYEGFPGFGTYWFKTNCGKTGGPHIHLKFSAITDPNALTPISSSNPIESRSLVGSVDVDGISMQGPKLLPLRADGKQNYNPETIGITTTTKLITSQNLPNTNTFTGKIKSYTNNNLVFDIKDFNGGNNASVQLFTNSPSNTENQRWYFDDVNRQVKGMNGKCLEASSTNYIKMQDCTTTTSQKWQFNSNNQIISEASSKCIEAQSGIVDGSLLIVNTCNTSNNNQKWNFADIVIITSGSTRINTRVNLAGPWNTTTKLMNKDLNTNNKIPLLQPFCTAPWNYCGTENIPSRANIDQSAVDWVLIEVKNTSGITVQRKAALITNDAFLTDANGINSPGNFYPVKFTNITSPGYYKVIVRHRNHLAIVTESNVYLTQSTSPSIYNNIDLTKNVNVKGSNQKLLGTNSISQNVYGLRVGDVNSDGNIDSADRSLINSTEEFINMYNTKDLNLDTGLDALDRSIMLGAQEAQENL